MAQLLPDSTIGGKQIASKDDIRDAMNAKFKVVTALPDNPDPDTFYFILE